MSKLIATAFIVGCAASASDAVGKFAVPFAACYLGSRVVLFGLYLRAWRHIPEARSTVEVYLLTVGTSAVLWAVSLLVPSPARYVLWGVAVAISAIGPLLATLRSGKVPLQIEHLPERFGLLVILVLGEAVGGAARGVHDASWTSAPMAVGLLAFASRPACGGSTSTSRPPNSTKELHETDQGAEAGPDGKNDEKRTDARHDLFVYGHLPLTLGIVLAGVGLEELVVHPETPGPSSAAWVFASASRSSSSG